MKYTLEGSEKVFYEITDIEANTIEEATEEYERMVASGSIRQIEDSEGFQVYQAIRPEDIPF